MQEQQDIKNWDVSIQSDLYEAGITEDGERFTAEYYYVVVQRKDGKRYAHKSSFYGTKQEESPDGFYFFPDIREEAKKEATKLLNQVKRSGIINLEYWFFMEPSYGSEYYCKVNGF